MTLLPPYVALRPACKCLCHSSLSTPESPHRTHRGHCKEKQLKSVKAEINPRMGKVWVIGGSSAVKAWEEESLVSTVFENSPP